MMGRARGQSMAHKLQMALMDMTGIRPSGQGILPLRHDRAQREQACQWWLNQVWNWQPPMFESEDDAGDYNSYPFEKTLYLLNTNARLGLETANFLELFCAAVLSQEDINGNIQGIKEPSVNENLVGSSLAMMNEFEKCVRCCDSNWNIAADITQLHHQVNTLACESSLQKAVVNIHAAGEYASLLAESICAKGESVGMTDYIEVFYTHERSNVSNVYEQWRLEVFRVLLYWDQIQQNLQES
jgi:hypothetical protein